MLSSIREGIAALGGSAELARRGAILLVAPADLPNLQAETVLDLLRRMRDAGFEAVAVPLARANLGRAALAEALREHPELALGVDCTIHAIAPRLIPEIDTLDLNVGLRQLRNRHAAELLEMETADAGVVQDVDTPEDFERAAGT